MSRNLGYAHYLVNLLGIHNPKIITDIKVVSLLV